MNVQIRTLREAKGLTQKELGQMVGASIRQIGYWEKGRVNLEDAVKVADVLECTLDELAGRDWPPGGPPTLSTDERGLVDSFRKMDPDGREKLRGVADTFVVASEKDGPGVGAHVERDREDVRMQEVNSFDNS